jgi:hypothetical protein
MNQSSHIQYLKRSEIDPLKWDNCVRNAANGLVYGYYEYLDLICDNWNALVLNDYEAVMPLPWRKKMGIRYIYFPPFCASLGIFGNNLSAVLVEQFLLSVPAIFRYWHFPLNHGNLFPVPGFPIQRRTNYILSLLPPYEQLYASFRQNIKRNIKKCEQSEFAIDTDFPIKEVTQLAKEFSGTAFYAEDDYNRMENVFNYFRSENNAITYGVRNRNGLLLAGAGFIFSHHRAYYLVVGNHPDGKTAGASHALIGAFIRDHAEKQLLLDFEGSDISSLAFFYSSFGATEEFYPEIRQNRLPSFLKWMKK